MEESYHKSITNNALIKHFNTAGLSLIKKSNVDSDSDKSRAAVGYDASAQHFNKTSLEECEKSLKKTKQVVIDDFIKAAKISDDNKDDESYKEAFYDLGRLTHTIQDFYSHTNWINQTGNKETVWNESIKDANITNPEKLKTGEYDDSSQRKDAVNHFFNKLNPLKWFESKNKKKENYEKTYIEPGAQSHYILNKDKPNSIADKAFKAQEGASGFELAIKDAEKHTEKEWQEILKTLDEKLDDETYKELTDDLKTFKLIDKNDKDDKKTKDLKETKEIEKTIEECRIKFDKKMHDEQFFKPMDQTKLTNGK